MVAIWHSMAKQRLTQGELGFGSGPEHGFHSWRKQRQDNLERLASTLGIPIGKKVEVWLSGEIRLRGLMLLDQECLVTEGMDASKLSFRVEGVRFTMEEVTSCVVMS